MESVPIHTHLDIVHARQRGRALAERIGFGGTDLTVIVTAVSELAHNIVQHANHGEIALSMSNGTGKKRGIVAVARDTGPGIPDIVRAMQDGWSTNNGLGLGLPGTRRLMDEFKVESVIGKGVTVTVKKWLP